MPLYDPPHLLKCIRNNLLIKNLEYDCEDHAKEEDRKFAEWDHIIKTYHIDLYSPCLNRMVTDLTDEHVYANKMNKNKLIKFVKTRPLVVLSGQVLLTTINSLEKRRQN